MRRLEGQPTATRYLVDSYLDWGQDLPGLKEYMDEQRLQSINLGYFGSGDPAHYGITYRSMPSVGLLPAGDGAQWWYEWDARPTIRSSNSRSR